MDGPAQWIGAKIGWRVSVTADSDVKFDGRIDTAEDFGDGVIRISGALADGGRFVLVTDESSLASAREASASGRPPKHDDASRSM